MEPLITETGDVFNELSVRLVDSLMKAWWKFSYLLQEKGILEKVPVNCIRFSPTSSRLLLIISTSLEISLVPRILESMNKDNFQKSTCTGLLNSFFLTAQLLI